GVSYPTVRNRLNEVVAALGGQPQDETEATISPPVEPFPPPPADRPDPTPRTRKQILDDLAAGKLSPEEAMTLLRSIK
ncbi:MAG: DUF2089 family protein, partial [Anaerolineae bacterium]